MNIKKKVIYLTLDEIKNPQDVYKFIDENIEYGWIDIYGNKQLNTMNRIDIKNKMFCCRIFEPDDYGNLEEEEHMHCFVLYYENNKVYHMEHPNFERKGIYEYSSEEEAIKKIVDYYIKLRGGKDSPTKEFFEVPVGITFKEFNKYINHV